jgi:hypothetical protein
MHGGLRAPSLAPSAQQVDLDQQMDLVVKLLTVGLAAVE